MKLSCVTATFNCVKAGNSGALVRCIESVAALKTPHEHLIYDGASTDGTVDLLRELEARTPNLHIISEPDTGIYNALNKGVRDAKGEWFYVLGSDDYIVRPDILDTLIRSAPQDVVMYASPVQMGWGIRPIRLHNMFNRTPYCHQGVVVRTSVMRSHGGFNEQFSICADYDFLLKVHLSAANIQYWKSPFAFYTGGTSENVAIALLDADRVIKKRFNVRATDLIFLRRNNFMPLRVWIRFLLHPDYAIRYAARKNAFAWMKRMLKIPLWPLVIIRRRILAKKQSKRTSV